MKNKTADNTSEHVAAAGIGSNTKFNWSANLVEDLLKALSNFKPVGEFQNTDFKVDKPRQYEEVLKQTLKINERYLEYFGPVSFPLFPSGMDDEEKIRLFEEERKLANEKIIIGCKLIRENTHIQRKSQS